MNLPTDPTSLPLRDIHLPDAISWWPLAPGWWLLFLLIILVGVFVLYLIRRRKHYRMSAIYLAKQELDKIKHDFNSRRDKKQLVQQVSELLRRISISVFERSETASLTGEDWLMFLDRFIENKPFSEGIGRALIEAPYQAAPEFDGDGLLQLTGTWIDAVNQKMGKAI